MRLCTRITEAWQSLSPALDPTKNVLTVDFEDVGDRLSSDGLVRLLTADELLPPYYAGGLILQNVTLDGPLVFDQVTVKIPLTFNNTTFIESEINREALGLRNRAAAIFMVGSHFSQRLLVTGSDIQGSVIVVGSVFDNGVAFVGTQIASDTAAGTGLFFRDNVIKPALTILDAELRRDVWLGSNEISALRLARSTFVGRLYALDNEINALEFGPDNSIEQRAVFRANRVAGDMKLYRLKMPETASLEVSANEITGNFVFRPTEIRAFIRQIDLSHNDVAGIAQITVPFDQAEATSWRGELNLTNLRVDGVLEVGLPPRQIPVDTQDKACSEIDVRKELPEGTLYVSLIAARIGVLNWRLPIDCAFRWNGAGLRYQHWGDPQHGPRKKPSGATKLYREQDYRKLIMQWRHTLAEPEVDSLTTIARYLKSHGSLIESLDILEEAKRENYSLSKEDLEELSGIKRITAFSVDGLIGLFLWPTGYGAKPYRAVIIIAGFAVVSALLFMCYRAMKRPGWDECEEGHTPVPGFLQFNVQARPQIFSLWRYSLDCIIPVVNLHGYDRYYADDWYIRLYSASLHVVGWWLVTGFLASATVL